MNQPSFHASVFLKGTLNIDKASALRISLLEGLGKEQELVIDLSEVEDSDLSCLQILYGAKRQASLDGKVFRVTGLVNPRLAGRLQRCGFSRGLIERGEDFETMLAGY